MSIAYAFCIMKKLILSFVFFLSVISAAVAQVKVNMTFDYTDPLTGVTFEVQKKIATQADNTYVNVTVTTPVLTTSETQGVPRYLVIDESPTPGTWIYRIAAIKNSVKSTYAVSNQGTVPANTTPPSNLQLQVTIQ